MDARSFFAVQVAATKAFGGIETALLAYGAMFDEVGISSICLYKGPGIKLLSDAGMNIILLPETLSGALRIIPGLAGSTVRDIRRRAEGRQILFIIHSDRVLGALRRVFPDAWFIAPCHSDKAKAKKKADLAITLNDQQQEIVRHVLQGSRCRAVELGNPFKANGRQAPEGRTRRLVFCARFTEIKNPLLLIKAHAALKHPVELLMIGDGPLMNEARAHAGENVRFLGWCSDPFQEITCDDILVSPSSWEGLPYLILEALDRAIPVVASDIAGHRAALDGEAFGTLFISGDHDALVDTLTTALLNPKPLKKKALMGQKSIAERFGPEVFWHRLCHELTTILSP